MPGAWCQPRGTGRALLPGLGPLCFARSSAALPRAAVLVRHCHAPLRTLLPKPSSHRAASAPALLMPLAAPSPPPGHRLKGVHPINAGLWGRSANITVKANHGNWGKVGSRGAWRAAAAAMPWGAFCPKEPQLASAGGGSRSCWRAQAAAAAAAGPAQPTQAASRLAVSPPGAGRTRLTPPAWRCSPPCLQVFQEAEEGQPGMPAYSVSVRCAHAAHAAHATHATPCCRRSLAALPLLPRGVCWACVGGTEGLLGGLEARSPPWLGLRGMLPDQPRHCPAARYPAAGRGQAGRRARL